MRNVLVFLDNFDTGGVTSVVRSIYRNLNGDAFNFDFSRRNVNLNDFDSEVLTNRNKIYYYNDCGLNAIPLWNYKHRQLFVAKQVIEKIKKSGVNYDVIHIHANPIIGLYIGKKLGIPVRIMHVHEAVPDFGDNIYRSKIMAFLWRYRQKKYNKWSTVKAGDSRKACTVKYGLQAVNDPAMVVLYPPVDMNKFDRNAYTEDERPMIPINSASFNIIHVGRLNPIKNQRFLIEVLNEINKVERADLYIVGDGELRKSLYDYAFETNVADRVHFLPGNTSPAIYKYMQCSMLPSFSEAFGMVAVESQLMGVPCFASTNVPNDVDIGMCTFLDLKAGAVKWADAILGYDYNNAVVNGQKKDRFKTDALLAEIRSLYCGGKES